MKIIFTDFIISITQKESRFASIEEKNTGTISRGVAYWLSGRNDMCANRWLCRGAASRTVSKQQKRLGSHRRHSVTPETRFSVSLLSLWTAYLLQEGSSDIEFKGIALQ